MHKFHISVQELQSILTIGWERYLRELFLWVWEDFRPSHADTSGLEGSIEVLLLKGVLSGASNLLHLSFSAPTAAAVFLAQHAYLSGFVNRLGEEMVRC